MSQPQFYDLELDVGTALTSIIIRAHRCRRAVNTPMIAVAANGTDVPKRTVPGERVTTLVPGYTDASYRLRAPRAAGESGG